MLTDMGLWAKMKDDQAKAKARLEQMAGYGLHRVDKGQFSYPNGTFKGGSKPITGASAEFESGADRSRPTLTRIGAGAILAGPAGAIVGGLFKKDTSKCYVTILFPDGDTVIIEGPSKDEGKMRQFAADVNRIAAN